MTDLEFVKETARRLEAQGWKRAFEHGCSYLTTDPKPLKCAIGVWVDKEIWEEECGGVPEMGVVMLTEKYPNVLNRAGISDVSLSLLSRVQSIHDVNWRPDVMENDFNELIKEMEGQHEN